MNGTHRPKGSTKPHLYWHPGRGAWIGSQGVWAFSDVTVRGLCLTWLLHGPGRVGLRPTSTC